MLPLPQFLSVQSIVNGY